MQNLGAGGLCACSLCLMVVNNPIVVTFVITTVLITCLVVVINIIRSCWEREKRLKRINSRRRSDGNPSASR